MTSNGRQKISTSILLFIYSIVFFGLLSIYLGQDNNFDLRNYHYYNAFAFFNKRIGFDYLPSQCQTFLNPAIDFLSYFLINHAHPILTGFIIGGIHGINYWLMLNLSLIIFNNILPHLTANARLILSLISAAAGVHGPGFFSELGTVMNDNLISIFVLVALLMMVKFIISGDSRSLSQKTSYLLLSGLSMGMGIGFKLTGAIYAFGLFAALFSLKGSRKDKVMTFCYWGAGMVGGILVSGGYWMAKIWSMFGNPVFPFYNHIFRSPYFAPVEISDKRFLPQDWLQEIFYPFYFCVTNVHVTEHPFRDIRWAVIYALLLWAAFIFFYNKCSNSSFISRLSTGARITALPNRLDKSSIFLLIFFATSYIVWELKFSIYRYIIPLEILAPITIFILNKYIFRKDKIVITLTVFSFLCIITTTKMLDWGRLPWKSVFFDIEVPAIDHSPNAIILITQNKAWSYLFPCFPPTVRFVRVNTSLTKPGDNNKFHSEIRDLIVNHNGPIYLLSNTIYEIEDSEIISNYELKPVPGQSYSIKSRHEQPGLNLVPLKKINTIDSNKKSIQR